MTKRPNGEGTVFYDLKSERYRAQFYDQDHKRRTLSSTSKVGIHKKLRDAVTARDAGLLSRRPSHIETLGECLDSWHEIQSKTLWEFKTSENIALDINRYIKPVIGHLRLDTLSPEIITKAYSKIKDQHNLSDASLNHVHRTMKTALKYSVKMRKIVSNPMDGVEAPRIRKRAIRVLEEKEMIRLISNIQEGPTEWNALWRITLLTGLRQGEVLGLTWENINLQTNTICITQQLQRQTGNGLVLKRLKTDNVGRFIHLDIETAAALKRWKMEQNLLKLQLSSWGTADLVFTNSLGKPIEPRRSARKWAELLKANKITHIKLHGARHSFATWAIKNGFDIKVVSHYLGHTDIKTTISIYQHITESSLTSAAEKMTELLAQWV
jgi:integrase